MGTSTVEITGGNFKETVDKSSIVLLDWWAPWCGPCRSFGPIFEKVASKHTDLVFGKVNTEDNQDLASQFGIQSIPTLMVFRDKILVFEQPGALPEPALEEIVKQVRGLDMSKVREEIAAQKAEKASTPNSN